MRLRREMEKEEAVAGRVMIGEDLVIRGQGDKREREGDDDERYRC